MATKALAFANFTIAALALAQSLFGAATIATDQSDYPPGSIVAISGMGFQPGESVNLRIDETPDTDGDSPIIWTVVADSSGNFTDTSFTTNAADAGVSFTLTATGQTSGLTAQTTFTDAATVDLTATKTNNVGGTTTLPNGWTWTIRVANVGLGSAAFTNTQTILTDTLPNSNISNYGTPAVGTVIGTVTNSSNISCAINSNVLTCTASGATVTLTASSSFDVTFTATPTNAGTFANPRGGANNCKVDPNNNVPESTENNNTCSNTVTVTAPDLVVSKANNVSDSTTLGNSWTWTLTVVNNGNAAASFNGTDVILKDNLPNSNINYGATPVVTPVSGITGTITCSINGSDNLSCPASGAVSIAAGGSFTVAIAATPTAVGTFANPRGNANSCAVDPDAHVAESVENNNTCNSNTVTVTAPDLQVSKTNSVSGSTTLGNSWTWTLTVVNNGNAAASFNGTDVILKDNLPNSNINYGATPVVTPVSGITGTITCSINGSDNLSCPASGAVSIAAGGSFTVAIAATPTAVGTFANPRGNANNCAVDPDAHVTESDETNNKCSDTVTVTAPDLQVSKTNSVSGSTTLGNSWTWTLTVVNNGNAAASFNGTDVILKDNLPNSNINYGATPVVTPVSGITGTITCSINGSDNLSCPASGAVSIAAGGSFTVAIAATPTAVGTFANPRGNANNCAVDPDAHVTESDETNNKCSDSVTVSAPDLTVSKTNTVSGSTTLGNSWTWTLTVANGGNAAASFNNTTILTDNLPNSNISYNPTPVYTPVSGITGTINCSISGSDLSCTGSGAVSIAVGGSFTVAVTATPSAIGTFANPRPSGACAVDPNANVTESDETNNKCSDTVTVSAPDLAVSKTNTVSGSTTLGNSWTWTLTVANGGNAAASFNNTTILTDNLPNSNISYNPTPVYTPVSGITGTINCSISGSDLNCTASGAASIAAGGSFTVAVTATPSAAGTFANPRATGICAVDPNTKVTESDESNNSCSDSVTVIAPDLMATKTNDAGGSVTYGNSWKWTITVANTGNAPAAFTATQTILTDNLPNTNIGYGATTVTPMGGITGTIGCSIGGSTLSCTASSAVSIPANGSFTVAFKVTPTAPGTFANPRSPGMCMVDPNNNVTEGNENNNTCSDSVLVVFNPDPVDFQVHYAANLNAGDSVINISSTGTSSSNVCVNIYAFSPDEQLIACCSCPMTPNALISLSARNDLVSNVLTPSVPTSIVIKFMASTSTNTTCEPSTAGLVGGQFLTSDMRAWGSTLHATPTPGTFAVTETPFSPSTLSFDELTRITTQCRFIEALGSGYGICKSCRTGGLGADRQ